MGPPDSSRRLASTNELCSPIGTGKQLAKGIALTFKIDGHTTGPLDEIGHLQLFQQLTVPEPFDIDAAKIISYGMAT